MMEAHMQQDSEIRGQGSLHQLFGPEIDASKWGVEQGLKVLYALQSEALRFATRRTHQNFEFIWDLTQCANPQDVLKRQQQWCSETTADYGEECGRMVGLGTDMATACLHPLKGLTCNHTRAPEMKRAA
jgi:hypothetical protein